MPVETEWREIATSEEIERWPNGDPVVVLRPIDVAMTQALVQVALDNDSEPALEQAMTSGPVQMLGYLTRRDGRAVAVDENGENPIEIGAGDILASPDMLRVPD